jgi:N4-gp56 family major capsid protein
MAITKFGVNDNLAVKTWSRSLAVEAMKATDIAPLIGNDADEEANNIVVFKRETKKEAGDKVTYGLNTQLSGDGVTENEVQEGKEESLTTYDDSITINELLHAVRVKNKDTIDTQRILFNMRKLARNRLRDWYATRMSVAFFNQVCGYTTETRTKYTGLNAVTAPTTNRIMRPTGVTTDEGLTSANKFDLTMIDYAVEKARLASPMIRPVSVKGAKKYVLYLHETQATDLRINTATGQWLEIQMAAQMGGKISGNSIYTDALGEYHDVVIRKSFHVTQGVNSTTAAAVSNTRRAVFLGVQAAVIAFSRNRSISDYKWVEKTFDYDRELGVSIQTIMGLHKTKFNSEDFGVIVIPTYAATHG